MVSHPSQVPSGGQPPPQGYDSLPPQAGAPYGGGYAGYAAPGYGYGAPQQNAVHEYNGAPPPGYRYGAPPANTGFSMDALGNIGGQNGTPAYGYGVPNPAAYAVAVPGYSGQGYPNGGAAQGYPVPNYPNGGAPQGYQNGGAPGYTVPITPGSTVYPEKPPGYPVGAPGYGYGAPGAVHPVGAFYPPSGGAPGYTDSQPSSHQPPGDPRNQIQIGRWTSGLCSCCDNCVPNLLLSWCCPFIPLAQVYARLGLQQYKPALIRFGFLYIFGLIGNFFGSSRRRSSTYNSYSSTSVYGDSSTTSIPAGMLFALILTVGQVTFRLAVWQARSKVRQRFAIPGSPIGDGCASCCCSCCAIAQLATHVKSYTPGDCSLSGPDVLPPYTD